MPRKASILALAFLLAASLLADEEPRGYKKTYFAATKPGSWAKYRMASPGTQEGFTTYTRLPDEAGRQRLLVRVDFTADGKQTTAYTDYTLEKGFSLEKDALSFGKAVEDATAWEEGDSSEDLPDEALQEIRDTTPDFAPRAVFVGTETAVGRACDHYKYTQEHPGDTRTFETGDIWLNETVPFGLVRQAGVTTDSSGRILSRFQMSLVDSGTSGGVAPRSRRPAAGPPVKLADAYRDGQVEIVAEAVEGSGGRLSVAFKNRTDEPIRLTIPNGPTALEVGGPVVTLRLDSPSVWLFDIAPGEASQPVEFSQAGGALVVAGKFTASLSGGKPVFSGRATLNTGK